MEKFFRGWFKRKGKAEQPEGKKEVKVEEEIDSKDLERQIMELGEMFEGSEGLKPKKMGLLSKITLFKWGRKKDIEIKEKDSKLFVECRDLIDKSNKYLKTGNKIKAKNIYSKARKTFVKLAHEEKKKIHNGLVKLYNKLSK